MMPRVGEVGVYLPIVGLSVVVGVATFVHLARRQGWSRSAAVSFQALIALGGLCGAWVYSLMERGIPGSALAGDPSALLRVGLRYPGGLVGAFLAALLAARRRPAGVGWLATLDVAAPATGFAMATVRIGCLLEGCCFGAVTDLPWGVQFPGSSPAAFAQMLAGDLPGGAAASLPTHPLQVYYALLAVGAGWLALRALDRRAAPGVAAATFLAIHETGRALLEPLRVPFVWHLEVASLALAGLGIAGLAWLGARQQRVALAR